MFKEKKLIWLLKKLTPFLLMGGVVKDSKKLNGQFADYYATSNEVQSIKNTVSTTNSTAQLALNTANNAQNTANTAKANGLQLYTHSRGNLTGSGANGKFKATVSETVTKLNVNGVSCTIKGGSETQMELIAGCWYTFILDGTTVNFSGGGAGAGLNFKIVGGTTQPVSPKENTIWVNTSTAIGEWQFAATEPTTRADGNPLQNGDVWIKTGLSSLVPINIVKNNVVMIYPVEVFLYNGNAWIKTDNAKIYQNGIWKNFDYVLYSNAQFASGRVEKNASEISVNNATGELVFNLKGSHNPSYHSVLYGWQVDLTPYSKVQLTLSNTSMTTGCGYGILLSSGTSVGEYSMCPYYNVTDFGGIERVLWTDTSSIPQTMTLDVSTRNGKFYIWCGGYTHGQNISFKITDFRCIR